MILTMCSAHIKLGIRAMVGAGERTPTCSVGATIIDPYGYPLCLRHARRYGIGGDV